MHPPSTSTHVITHLLLFQYKIPNLTIPTRERSRQFGVELAGSRAIRSTLAYLEVNEQFTCGIASMGQYFLAIDLVFTAMHRLKVDVCEVRLWTYPNVCVLKGTICAANLFEPRDPGLDQVLCDTQAFMIVSDSGGVLKVLDSPSLHVCLTVFLLCGIVEL